MPGKKLVVRTNEGIDRWLGELAGKGIDKEAAVRAVLYAYTLDEELGRGRKSVQHRPPIATCPACGRMGD